MRLFKRSKNTNISPVDSVQPEPMTEIYQMSPEPPRPQSSHEGLKSVFSTLAILIIAPVIALCLTAFVFQSYEVDGPSMQTTLQNHDRLIVIKLPKTLAKITSTPYVPERGEIVIFTKQEVFDTNVGGEKQLIKRVIGVPGDHVVVKDGIITVYNNQHPTGFQPDKAMPYGKVITTTPGNVDLVVPKDQIFVCGDNRLNSFDSRSFGTVKADDIVGKLAIRIFPFSKAQTF